MLTHNIIEPGKSDLQEPVIRYSEDQTPFSRLDIVNTIAATPVETTLENVRFNIKRSLPRLHDLEEFKKIKDESIALVGGGPSLIKTKEELINYKNIIACGSSHDYITTNGIVPKYCVVCDPDPISANYLRYPHRDTIYLISTGCDKEVFDALKGYKIYQWHCYSDETLKVLSECDGENFQAVGGGCTVGLRSLSIALMLGYHDIHFFGFDSCLYMYNLEDGTEGVKHHAYDFTDNSKEFIGDIYQVRLGNETDMNNDKAFACAGYQIAQCNHFKDFYQRYNQFFKPTFHGEGLLTELMRVIEQEKIKLSKLHGEQKEITINKNLEGLLQREGVI